MDNLEQVGQFIHVLRSLKSVWVTGNPCFPEDTASDRATLIRFIDRAQARGFSLNLNDSPVSVAEQVDGMQLRLAARNNRSVATIDPTALSQLDHEYLHQMYLALTLDSLGVTGLETALNLSHCGLKYFGSLVRQIVPRVATAHKRFNIYSVCVFLRRGPLLGSRTWCLWTCPTMRFRRSMAKACPSCQLSPS